ncbi:hypothetical protein MTO96_013106 [Rhipicephalus appendiculatus]
MRALLLPLVRPDGAVLLLAGSRWTGRPLASTGARGRALSASDALMVRALKSRRSFPFSRQISAKAPDDVISGAHAARPGGGSSSKDRPN